MDLVDICKRHRSKQASEFNPKSQIVSDIQFLLKRLETHEKLPWPRNRMPHLRRCVDEATTKDNSRPVEV